MTRRNLLLISIVLWLYVVIGAMLANEYLDLELLFVLWLIGLTVVTQVAALPYAEPAYLTRQKYLIIVGVVIFAHIVAVKILEVLLV
jgi:hypothetical protein